MNSRDARNIIIVAVIVLFWPEILSMITPKPKVKKEKDVDLEGAAEPLDGYCKNIVYQPLSPSSEHFDSTLPKDYCYKGDSYWEDKPHTTGDAYADDQAKDFEDRMKFQGDMAEEMKNITIVLSNEQIVELDTSIMDSDDTVVFPIPTPPIEGLTDKTPNTFQTFSASSTPNYYQFGIMDKSPITARYIGLHRLGGDHTGNDGKMMQTSSQNGLTWSMYANAIVNATGTTFNDYYLPSQLELKKMHTELKAHAVGNFVSAPYWSSTEVDADNAKYVHFTTGNAITAAKFILARIRPCRTFTSSTVYALRDNGPAYGWIFNITDNGDGTYTYLESARDDLGANAFSDITDQLIGTTSSAIGTGLANTNAIVAQPGHTSSAAQDSLDLSANTDYDVRNYGGGYDSRGRFYCFYSLYNTTIAWIGLYLITSDDDGVTWSDPQRIDEYTSSDSIYCNNKLIELHNGTLIQPSHAIVAGVYKVGYLQSTDKGVTWSFQTIASTSTAYTYAEPSIVEISTNNLLCVARKTLTGANTCYHQFYSSTNGLTWTDQGDTTFDTWSVTAGHERPCFLAKISYYGKEIIACYYVNTSDFKFNVIYAKASDFVTLGVNAWNVSTLEMIKQLEEYTAGCGYVGDGYQTIIHDTNLWGGIGQIYVQKTVTPTKSDIEYFWTLLSNRETVINLLYP